MGNWASFFLYVFPSFYRSQPVKLTLDICLRKWFGEAITDPIKIKNAISTKASFRDTLPAQEIHYKEAKLMRFAPFYTDLYLK